MKELESLKKSLLSEVLKVMGDFVHVVMGARKNWVHEDCGTSCSFHMLLLPSEDYVIVATICCKRKCYVL